MSIRRTNSPPVISDNDLQLWFKGRHLALEITEFNGVNIITLVEQIGGEWRLPNTELKDGANFSMDWQSNEAITKAGGARTWVKTVLLPWLNGLLLQIFPPSVSDFNAPERLSAIDQVDALLTGGSLVVRTSPGGSPYVTMID